MLREDNPPVTFTYKCIITPHDVRKLIDHRTLQTLYLQILAFQIWITLYQIRYSLRLQMEPEDLKLRHYSQLLCLIGRSTIMLLPCLNPESIYLRQDQIFNHLQF